MVQSYDVTIEGNLIIAVLDLQVGDKEIEVSDFYRSESKARGTWQPSSASAGYSEAARRAGDRAGRRARIGADREFGGTRGALE